VGNARDTEDLCLSDGVGLNTPKKQSSSRLSDLTASLGVVRTKSRIVNCFIGLQGNSSCSRTRQRWTHLEGEAVEGGELGIDRSEAISASSSLAGMMTTVRESGDTGRTPTVCSSAMPREKKEICEFEFNSNP
jgi:hypothetical protein